MPRPSSYAVFWLKKKGEDRCLDGLKGHRSVGGIRASIYNAMPLACVEALSYYIPASTAIYSLSLHDALPIFFVNVFSHIETNSHITGSFKRLTFSINRHTTNQNVKKRPACSELRWAYCNHKATYFASYLTGGDCVPDDQN